MTTRELLAPLIVRARDEVGRHRGNLARAEGRLQFLTGVARRSGSGWRRVQDVELTIGRLYVVRRVSPRLGRQGPAVARWDESGWKILAGDLLADHGSGATVEVWEGVP